MSRTRLWAAAAGLVAVAGAAVVLVAATGGGDEQISRQVSGDPRARAQFVVICSYGHSAPDDPIVHPGEPGRSHRHDFFGNTTTDADSTIESLEAGGTTCQQRLDRAAYWSPSVVGVDGPIEPVRAVAYYRAGPEVDPLTVEPYPRGLMMIAGDAVAPEPQNTEIVGWHCGQSPVRYSSLPACPESATLALRVVFPDCWDGERLDSVDHKEHVAYSRGGSCPGSHPVPIPELTLDVQYPVVGDPSGLSLASGAATTAHADFMNAWDADKLANEIDVCLKRNLVCKVVDNVT